MMGSTVGRPAAAPARDYPEGPAEAPEGQNLIIAVDQESGVAITGHLRHTVSEPRNTNPEIDTVRGNTGRPGSEARPTLSWNIAVPSPAMENIGSEMPGSQSLATVADGSAFRMVPDGKSPKVTGGADLTIGSKGYSGARNMGRKVYNDPQCGAVKRYTIVLYINPKTFTVTIYIVTPSKAHIGVGAHSQFFGIFLGVQPFARVWAPVLPPAKSGPVLVSAIFRQYLGVSRKRCILDTKLL